MLCEKRRKMICGEMCEVYTYDGKMRFDVTGTFSAIPAGKEKFARKNGWTVEPHDDGSVSITSTSLVDFDAALTEEDFQTMMDKALNKFEDVLSLPPDNGYLTSAGWWVGAKLEELDRE